MADWKEQLDRRRLAFALRAIRKSKGLSKAVLADKAGYKDVAIITALENASKTPDDIKLKDLANALDVSINQLRGICRFEISDSGWPKINESEKIALSLVAPMIRNMPDEDIRQILDLCLVFAKARGKEPSWQQTEFQRKAKNDILR